MYLRLVSCAFSIALIPGCGLVLDLAPPDQTGFDASIDAGRSDASAADAEPPPPTCTTDVDCSNGDVCDGEERCTPTGCVTGTALVCVDDGIVCTIDECDPIQGCSYPPDDTVCTDGAGGRCDPVNDCQYATCDSNTCAPQGCRDAMCAPDGTCLRPPLTGTDVPCDDGDPCTSGTTCDGLGACGLAEVVRDCDDENPCTADACPADPTHECIHTNRTRCDDDPCTIDACVFASGAVAPTCVIEALCSDDLECTDDVCTVSDTGTASCSFPGLDNTPCEGGTCQGGVCVAPTVTCPLGRSECGGSSATDCECMGYCDPRQSDGCGSTCFDCGSISCLGTEICCACGGCFELGTTCPARCNCPSIRLP